jgi:hypothetical protein
MTKEVLTLALEALKLSDTVFYPQTKIAIAAIERALANHIKDNLAMVAQPTPAEYAMGYAEGFNDACKPNYTALPQRPWVGLTEEDAQNVIKQAMHSLTNDSNTFTLSGNMIWVAIVNEVEAKLKEKNNG